MVFCAEILFMNRLDMAKNADVVENWTTSFFQPSSVDGGVAVDVTSDFVGGDSSGEVDTRSCEKWLEREDAVPYARDFDKEPVLVTGKQKVVSLLLSLELGSEGFEFGTMVVFVYIC